MQLVLLVVCLGVHEAAHAWSALKCGDSTARDEGRMTLNPIVHIDLWMTILLPAILLLASNGRFVFGGAKPVPVLFHRLRHPWRDMSLVALAGPFSNLLLAVLFIVLYKFFIQTGWYNGAADDYFTRQGDLLPVVMKKVAKLNLLLTVFNLVPIPPLDGSRVMTWLLPSGLREGYRRLEGFGMLAVVLLVFYMPGFSQLLIRTMGTLLGAMDSGFSLLGL